MRTVIVSALTALGLCWLGCADTGDGDAVAVERAALGHSPNPDLDRIGARYIVKFKDVGAGKAALAAVGAHLALDLGQQNAAAYHIPPRALEALSNHPAVDYIESDPVRRPLAQTTPWGIPRVQANLVSDAGAGAVTVCIIDGAYALEHDDLPPNAEATSASYLASPEMCHHGTHVAGTIAAVDNAIGVIGVLPNQNIGLQIVKVFGDSGDEADPCTWSYGSDLVAALNECMSNTTGPLVVNMSLGGSVKSRTEERAFRDAFNTGHVLSIAAAGNDGNTRSSYPASYDSVVSVAAIDSTNTVADFSQQNAQVELSGPGVAVRSTVPPGEGTSESLTVGSTTYEATALEFSPNATASGDLFRCDAVDGLGSPGDCVDASGKVCLISRGSITFKEKVDECAAQGGVGAVIFNNAPALFSGTLGSATTIPAVGVSGVDGAVLEGLADSATTVETPVGDYSFYDGTSMATPHVVGVAALVWSTDTSCSNQEIRDALGATATDLGTTGRDNAYGFGLVQAQAAANALDCGGGTGSPCGDGVCDSDENATSCPADCDGGGTCSAAGAACSANSECCSNNCKGKPGAKTCK